MDGTSSPARRIREGNTPGARFSGHRLEIEMTPASHQAIAACDKLHRAVLRDHDRKALRKIAAESISRAVAGAGVFSRLWNRNLRFQIQRSVHNLVLKARHLNLGAVTRDGKPRVKQ